MALTSTEENQLRELLRRMNATQTGKTVDQLRRIESGSGVTDVVIRMTGGGLARASQGALIDSLLDNSVPSNGVRRTTADQTVNHLMTRDATRSEIDRLTRTDIDAAAQLGRTAQASANANTTAINGLRSDHGGRITGLENWRTSVVTPQLANRLSVAGSVYASNPIMQVGSMNPVGIDIANRTHRFPVPMARDPIILFSLQGDVNYPRYEFLIEAGRVVGFVLFHSPTGGRWMAVGTQA
jgi:hypothetical protein|nr:MAG TPA: hypothetical protein [Caudoviricetes sp.]